jgi:hypothetical protein
MPKVKIAKPPMDPSDLTIETRDVTQEQFPKGIPTNPDGSVKQDGAVSVDEAATIGAMDAESAQKNKTNARILHKKNRGDSDVKWNEQNGIHLYDNIKRVSAWGTGNMWIYFTLVKSSNPENPMPGFLYKPVLMSNFKNASELFSYMETHLHRDSPYDCTYQTQYKEGGREIRGTGYVSFQGVAKDAPPLPPPPGQQQSALPPWPYPFPPPPGFPYGSYAQPTYGAGYPGAPGAYLPPQPQPYPPQPEPPQHAQPSPPQAAPPPPPPMYAPPPTQQPPGADPTTAYALGVQYQESQKLSAQVELLARQFTEANAREAAFKEYIMSGRMGVPQAQSPMAPPPPPPAPPPPQAQAPILVPTQPPSQIIFDIPCTRCNQLVGPKEGHDLFAATGQMIGRVHKTCPQSMPVNPIGMGYAPPQAAPTPQPPPVAAPPASSPPAPADPMADLSRTLASTANIFSQAFGAVTNMQETVRRTMPELARSNEAAAMIEAPQADDAPYGSFPILDGAGAVLYDRGTKKALPLGYQVLNNAGAVAELLKAGASIVKEMAATLKPPAPPPPPAVVTQGYTVPHAAPLHAAPPAPYVPPQASPPPPPAPFKAPNLSGIF